MSLKQILILSAAGLLWTSSARGASLPVKPFLPLALAQQLAQAAMRACADRGANVAVAVVGETGEPRVLLVAHGARPIEAKSAMSKASTAAQLQISSQTIFERVRQSPTYAEILRSLNPDIVPAGGALPLFGEKIFLGAIGVGGAANGEEDAACARAGIEALSKMSGVRISEGSPHTGIKP